MKRFELWGVEYSILWEQRMEKDRSPRVLDVLIPGCWRRIDPLDLRARYGCFTIIRWMMYSGAEEWMPL